MLKAIINPCVSIEGSYSNHRINLFEPDNAQLPNWSSTRPQVMSEREVREVMHQYNGSIDSFTREIDELKAKSKELDSNILDIKESLVEGGEEKTKVRKEMHNSYTEKERLALSLKELNYNIQAHKDLQEVDIGKEMDLKKQILAELPEIIPDAEGLSRSNEIVAELFNNYNSTMKRLEQLTEENADLNRKNNQERIFQDIQNLNSKLTPSIVENLVIRQYLLC